ncbi:MAG TPA: preprotein translocase subunit SecE [Acidimicrobiales bacterium]|nr:preprotein translocase subunit SecE [Acidimicrobiales bacterium]
MAMNRQQKRQMQRAGQIGEDGAPKSRERRQSAQQPQEERTSPLKFLGEVRAELKKVAWPTRTEVINYSVVVFVCIVLLTALIAGLDYFLGEAVFKLFER